MQPVKPCTLNWGRWERSSPLCPWAQTGKQAIASGWLCSKCPWGNTGESELPLPFFCVSLSVQRGLFYIYIMIFACRQVMTNRLASVSWHCPCCWQGCEQSLFSISAPKEVALPPHPWGLLLASAPPALACWTGSSAREGARLPWTQGSSANICEWQISSIIVSVPRGWYASRCCYCRQGIRSHSLVLNLCLCKTMVGGKGEEASCLLSLLLVFTHGCQAVIF